MAASVVGGVVEQYELKVSARLGEYGFYAYGTNTDTAGAFSAFWEVFGIFAAYLSMLDSNSSRSKNGNMSSSDGETIEPSGICLAESLGENM